MRTLLLIALLGLAGCQALRIEDARLREVTDWRAMDGTHAASAQYTPPLGLEWKYSADAGFGPGAPLVIGDVVVVGNRNGELHAIDLDSGRRLGMQRLDEPLEGSPAIRGNMLYVVHAWGRKTVRALDLDRGVERWSARLGPIEAAPIIAGDILVVAAADGTVSGLDPSDGATLWERSLGAPIQASPVRAAGNFVAVAATDGVLTALDPEDGGVAWTADAEGPVYAALSRAPDGTVIAATTRGTVAAFDGMHGHRHWLARVGEPFERVSAPASDAELVVVGTTAGGITALGTADGTVHWEARLDEGLSAPPLLTPSHVFVASLGRQLAGMARENGAVVWSTELDGRVKSGMTATRNGILLLAEPRNVLLFTPRDLAEVQDAP